MTEYFVVLVNVTFCMKLTDWYGGEYLIYPTNEEIKECLEKFINYGTSYEKATVHYARVEKRFMLNK
jgi:hypothetical protein